jgi:hypothetical protein
MTCSNSANDKESSSSKSASSKIWRKKTCICRGVDKFFKNFAKLASSSDYYSPSQETTDPKYRKGHWEGEKPLPDWQVGLYFYSPSLNSTRIWRVVIRTPAIPDRETNKAGQLSYLNSQHRIHSFFILFHTRNMPCF